MSEAEEFEKSIRRVVRQTLVPFDKLAAAMAVFQKISENPKTEKK